MDITAHTCVQTSIEISKNNDKYTIQKYLFLIHSIYMEEYININSFHYFYSISNFIFY